MWVFRTSRRASSCLSSRAALIALRRRVVHLVRIGPELRVEDGRRTSLVLLGPRGEHRDDDAHGVAGGSKMMGKTTDTIPPSGWGKLRFEKPRTTHATTEASLIAVDVSVALLMTLPCLSITNFVATVPVNFGSACNPCDGTTVRGNRTGGYSCSARSVRPRALANQRRSPRRARSNQSSASASASPPSTRALGPACPTAAASASRWESTIATNPSRDLSRNNGSIAVLRMRTRLALLLVLVLAHRSVLADESPLGEVGESCRVRADCRHDLHCIDDLCTSVKQGASSVLTR